MADWLRKAGHLLRFYVNCSYTYWKVRETGFKFRKPLNSVERDHFLCFRSALRGKNLVVYDIGAANGLVSCCFAKLQNVNFVHAFEPIPSAFTELQANTIKLGNIICHPVALGDFNGEHNMWVIDESRDSSSIMKMGQIHKDEVANLNFNSHPEIVTVVRLDDYVRDQMIAPPDVIKIDVQGFESQVLKGGLQTIRQARFCILEISFMSLYEGSPIFDEIYMFMRAAEFNLVGVCEHTVGESGSQLQMDGIFRNERRM